MILIINTGSSSIKYKLFDNDKVVKSGSVDRIGQGEFLNHLQAWERLYQSVSVNIKNIQFVGHRVVHGGDRYSKTTLITKNVISDLESFVPLAPLHLPPALEIVKVTMSVFAEAKHYAIFDTSFYHNMPNKAMWYALKKEVLEQYKIRRFGFHGVSHQYALRKVQKELGMIRTQRTISVHLGSGCSISAIKDGVCVDTSMGFTPMEGLVMMTRSGDIDPGVIFYLLKNGFDVDRLEELLNKESGVFGISGLSSDMRDVLYIAGYKVDDEKYTPPKDVEITEDKITSARLAVEIFAYRIIKYIGAYIVVLGGLDALVFTGSIGVGSEELRNLITSYLAFAKDYEIYVAETNEEEEMMIEVMKAVELMKAPV